MWINQQMSKNHEFVRDAYLPERVMQLLRGHGIRVHSTRSGPDILHIVHLPTELTSGVTGEAVEKLSEDIVVTTGRSGGCDLGVELGDRGLPVQRQVSRHGLSTVPNQYYHLPNSNDRRPRL